MNNFLDFNLFEKHYSRNNKAVDELFEKCVKIYRAVDAWTKIKKSETSRAKSVKSENEERSAKKEIEWWLGGIEDGEVKNLYEKVIDGNIIPTLFWSNQGFYNIKISFDIPIEDMPGFYMSINVNIGHDGEKLVLCVTSGYKEFKNIEDSIKAYLEEHCDFEFKINGLTLIEYMKKNRGIHAAKKFGFDPKYDYE